MPIADTVLTFVGGGVTGSLLAYGLTWSRERRRTIDAYGAPQRDAIEGIISATHELLVREAEFRQTMEDLANEAEGKPHRKHSDKELDDVASNLNRAILAFEKAFNVGRFTIVEAECYEAMGIAYNAFVRIKDRLSDVETMAQTPANIRRVVGELTKSVRELNTHVADLVRVGQRRVSPMQTWRNKRRRREVRTRLEEKYFKLSTESGQT
jgi:hypothetical protein